MKLALFLIALPLMAMAYIKHAIHSICRRIAVWLFDEYMHGLIDEYVRRERDRWADAFEVEKRRNAQVFAHRDALLAILTEQIELSPNPPLVVFSQDIERWMKAQK